MNRADCMHEILNVIALPCVANKKRWKHMTTSEIASLINWPVGYVGRQLVELGFVRKSVRESGIIRRKWTVVNRSDDPNYKEWKKVWGKKST